MIRGIFRLLTEGALGGSDRSTHGRASSLGGHLGGQTGSEDTGSGHCDGVRREGVERLVCVEEFGLRFERGLGELS